MKKQKNVANARVANARVVNNGVPPKERKAYTTECYVCELPVTECECADGPSIATLPDEPCPLHDEPAPTGPKQCPVCGTHLLSMATGINL